MGEVVSAIRQALVHAFNGRRVLLTGDTGFKGSWLALWLLELGAEVTGVALPPDQTQRHFQQLGLANRYRHVDLDIVVYRDPEQELYRLLCKGQPAIAV